MSKVNLNTEMAQMFVLTLLLDVFISTFTGVLIAPPLITMIGGFVFKSIMTICLFLSLSILIAFIGYVCVIGLELLYDVFYYHLHSDHQFSETTKLYVYYGSTPVAFVTVMITKIINFEETLKRIGEKLDD